MVAAAVVLFVAIAAVSYYYSPVFKGIIASDDKKSGTPASQTPEDSAKPPEAPVVPQAQDVNETEEGNETIGGGGGGGGGAAGTSSPAGPAVMLEIFEICAGDMPDEVNIFENSSEFCLNKKNPYYIILDKNSTHLKTNFSGTSGFNRTYDIYPSVRAFIIYIRDLNTLGTGLSGFPDEIIFTGSMRDYVSVSSFEQGTFGSTAYASVPLNIASSIPATAQWENLKVYLNTPLGEYFIGDIWLFVTQS